MRPRLSIHARIHQFFTIVKNTMELNVFYCTMHNSIDIFLLLHVIRSCHEMTIIVSYIDSAPFLKQLQIIASSVFIYFVKMISFFIFLHNLNNTFLDTLSFSSKYSVRFFFFFFLLYFFFH